MSVSIKVDIHGFEEVQKLINPRTIRRNLTKAVDQTANIVRDDFRKTVRTWDTKPRFIKRGPVQKTAGPEANVGTDSEIYLFVDSGTKAHLIRPRNVGLLRFQSGYTAKTRVRVVGSRGGGPRGPFVTAKSVRHPGTKARKFADEISRRRVKNLRNLTRLAINRSLRR